MAANSPVCRQLENNKEVGGIGMVLMLVYTAMESTYNVFNCVYWYNII